jgi:hypothetical protein
MNIEIDLKCKICCELYDLKDNEPKIFPKCGHTICKSCLKHQIESTKSLNLSAHNWFLRCPFDKSENLIRENTTDADFPKNFVLNEIIEKVQGKKNTNNDLIQNELPRENRNCNFIHNDENIRLNDNIEEFTKKKFLEDFGVNLEKEKLERQVSWEKKQLLNKNKLFENFYLSPKDKAKDKIKNQSEDKDLPITKESINQNQMNIKTSQFLRPSSPNQNLKNIIPTSTLPKQKIFPTFRKETEIKLNDGNIPEQSNIIKFNERNIYEQPYIRNINEEPNIINNKDTRISETKFNISPNSPRRIYLTNDNNRFHQPLNTFQPQTFLKNQDKSENLSSSQLLNTPKKIIKYSHTYQPLNLLRQNSHHTISRNITEDQNILNSRTINPSLFRNFSDINNFKKN